MVGENPYTVPTSHVQSPAVRKRFGSKTVWQFVAGFCCVLVMLFQLSETTTNGIGKQSRFGFPVFFIVHHGPTRTSTSFQFRPAVVNLAFASVVATALIPAVRLSHWFVRHIPSTIVLVLLAMACGFRDWIFSLDAPWFFDLSVVVSLTVFPWLMAYQANSYRLALVIPLSTSFAWGVFARCTEIHLQVYDNQPMLSVLGRSMFALAVSGLSCSSIFLHGRRSKSAKCGT